MADHVDTMGGVCRLWSQHIAVDEPLRSQTCQAKFANRRCVCEPSNRVSEPPYEAYEPSHEPRQAAARTSANGFIPSSQQYNLFAKTLLSASTQFNDNSLGEKTDV